MERKYIPVFFDWIEVTAELSAEEKGRLVDALVLLARGEDWKSRVQGNERFVFPFLRSTVERSLERSAAQPQQARRAESRRSGIASRRRMGKQMRRTRSKRKQTQANPGRGKQGQPKKKRKKKKKKKRKKKRKKKKKRKRERGYGGTRRAPRRSRARARRIWRIMHGR